MAEHVGTGQVGDVDSKRSWRQLLSQLPWSVSTGIVLVVTTGALVGWYGWRIHEDRQAQVRDDAYLQTARQAALNLTTISYAEVDRDIKRILDSTTGGFRDDFQRRSAPFLDVVKQARSTSQGAVTEAGLESVDGNHAQVLLAVSVKTSLAAGEPGPPRNWRMRISVEQTGDGTKVSNVQFVP